MGATEAVAKFVAETDYEDMPEAAIANAKMAILDCVGTALAGSAEPVGKLMSEYVRDMACSPAAGVIGGGFKTAASLAALANGTMGHALDYDDCIGGGGIHPSVPLLPAVLALGEQYGISGREALLAYILGFEVETKLFEGMTYKHYAVGWHATSTVGTLGAAAACSKLLGLSVAETKTALGIASSRACGIRQNFGSMTKPYHAGAAAENGVSAALLAKRGFTASDSILETPVGFLNVFAGEGEYELEKMTQNLGDPLSIVSPGVTIKPYPACLAAHRCLDAMMRLIREHDISADAVGEVVCTTCARYPKVMIHRQPKSGLEGKFSLEYCMAIALLDRTVGLGQFADDKVQSSKAKEMVKHVRYQHPPEYPEDIRRLPKDKVTVRLTNGKEYAAEVEYSKGDPRNPLGQEELASKYRDCARLALSSQEIEHSLNLVSRLEEIGNIAALMEVVTTRRGG
jgi:2-methylcitrate dehydratase PrpD